MRQLARLIKRFGADERGMFVVIFGVMAVVLFATAGAVVDFVTLQQARNRAQVALDAAALALQPRIFEDDYNEEETRVDAEALVIERVADDRITAKVDVIDTDTVEGSLYLEAYLDVPTYFVALVGVPKLEARLASEATRKMLDLEVAMVLDNSGSMSNYSRMTYLKEAADCATNILFYETVDEDCELVGTPTAKDNVKMGIVPFTIMVNIGTQFEDATWLDWTGQSMIGKLNFDDDDDETTAFTGAVNRRDLFEQTGTEWRGCVEARLAPYDTTDDPPDVAEGMFVPFFSPDTASGNYNSYVSDRGGTCERKTCRHEATYDEDQCYWDWDGGWKRKCNGPPEEERFTLRIGNSTTYPATSCIPADGMLLDYDDDSDDGEVEIDATYSLLSERELQERLCKYNGTTPDDNTNSGPNAYCPDVTMLPLTDDPATVFDKIDDMRADGGTNIQQGAVWGMHMLTSTEPLTQALPKDSSAVSKVMIVMTDGYNEPDYKSYGTTWNGTGIYFSWGFRKDGRLADTDGILDNEGEYDAFDSKAEMSTAMNGKLVAACNSAKAAGITVYTIGLSSPSTEATQTLTDCASTPDHAHFPNDPDDLLDTFRGIAEELAQLRLAL